jgi:hypothetical protein
LKTASDGPENWPSIGDSPVCTSSVPDSRSFESGVGPPSHLRCSLTARAGESCPRRRASQSGAPAQSMDPTDRYAVLDTTWRARYQQRTRGTSSRWAKRTPSRKIYTPVCRPILRRHAADHRHMNVILAVRRRHNQSLWYGACETATRELDDHRDRLRV